MAAPRGNKFWQLRSKHGRDKLFATPELMWEAACEYFEWCENNPLKEIDFVGKDATEVTRKKLRPFTLQGLCLYLDCSTEFFRHFEENNKDSQDFMPIITRINDTIYNQKFTGAASGLLVPLIIARDLGLADKKELKHDGQINLPDVSKLSDKTLDSVINELGGNK